MEMAALSVPKVMLLVRPVLLVQQEMQVLLALQAQRVTQVQVQLVVVQGTPVARALLEPQETRAQQAAQELELRLVARVLRVTQVVQALMVL